MLNLLFFLSLFLILYTYLGYPLILAWWAKHQPKPVAIDHDFLPAITVVVTIHNEAANITTRLDNLMAQDYPPEKLHIIVVSDGSSDHSPVLVSNFIHRLKTQTNKPAVQLVHYAQNQGKAHAVNLGVAAANTEIVVLADARQQFAADAFKQLIKNFADKTVGCVSGELVYHDSDNHTAVAMGAYWHYEKWIRKTESQIHSVIGATGCIYALRKNLYRPIPANTLLDDVLIPLKIIQQGHRVVFDNQAHAYDHASQQHQQEWRRKVRTLAGVWQLFNLEPRLFLPSRNPVWFQLWSHKIARLLVPFALIVCLLSSLFLPEPFYQSVFWLQIAAYTLVMLANVWPHLRRFRLINLCHTVAFLNLAALAGFYYWLTGQTASIWRAAYK